MDATGVDAGERVSVEVDTKPREVAVPRDLAAALERNGAAQAAFDKLSFTHKLEYVDWIEQARRPETCARQDLRHDGSRAGEQNRPMTSRRTAT